MKKITKLILIIVIVGAAAVFGLSAYVALSTQGDIAASQTTAADDWPGIDEVKACKDIKPQCILVLGCAVWENNQPSPMLKDRMDTAIALYEAGVSPKLLLSGDNSVVDYSEPDCMLAYALEHGVPEEDIFLDFAGFSTYDSVYRAKAIFQASHCIIVTQKYHMFRALKISRALGLTAKGVSSDQRKYAGRYMREFREVLARDKDLAKGILKLEPTFLGEEIPISGDGRVTHVNQ